MPDYVLHSDSKFDLKDHVELGKIHKIICLEQSAKVSGVDLHIYLETL